MSLSVFYLVSHWFAEWNDFSYELKWWNYALIKWWVILEDQCFLYVINFHNWNIFPISLTFDLFVEIATRHKTSLLYRTELYMNFSPISEFSQSPLCFCFTAENAAPLVNLISVMKKNTLLTLYEFYDRPLFVYMIDVSLCCIPNLLLSHVYCKESCWASETWLVIATPWC